LKKGGGGFGGISDSTTEIKRDFIKRARPLGPHFWLRILRTMPRGGDFKRRGVVKKGREAEKKGEGYKDI